MNGLPLDDSTRGSGDGLLSTELPEWSPAFEEILRRYLPNLESEVLLQADHALVALGLDSLGLVGLLVDIETTFGFSMSEELINGETFYSAQSLWRVLQRCDVVERSGA